MNRLSFVALATLILVATSFATANSGAFFTQENALGPVTDPPPLLARQASPNEFENSYREGALVLDVPSRALVEIGVMNDETRQLESLAKLSLSPARPDLIPRLLKIRTGGDVVFDVKSQRGDSLRRSLMGRDATLRELIGAHQNVDSLTNLRTLHSQLVARLTHAPDLTSIDVSQMSEDDLQLLNELLLSRLDGLYGSDGGARVSRIYGDCLAEEGSGAVGEANEGDQTGRRCEANPRGLIKMVDWAMKPFNTCVRNQGERTASAVFALTAAVEARVAKSENRYANLSEQHLLNQAKMHWFRSPGDLGEGFTPLLSAGRERLTGYRFHFEDVWSFNPAYGRKESAGQWRSNYVGSCDKYSGRHCSESSHQGRLLCTTVGDQRYCGYDAPMTAATPISINGLALLFDVTNPDEGLMAARHLLRASVPTVLTAAIPSSFAQLTGEGYVLAANSRERIEGAHAMALTGWVPNTALPAGLPQAPGGGYFVAKNSWGTCFSDAGYVYLSYDWVRAHALNLTAVF